MNYIYRMALYIPAVILTILSVTGCKLDYLMTLDSDTKYVEPGDPVTLSWSFETTEDIDLVDIEITPELGEVDPTGSETVYPVENTNYTMTATFSGPDGNILKEERSLNITVANPEAHDCLEYEPACVQNYNQRTDRATGKKSLVVVPINFSDTDWNPPRTKIEKTMSHINEFVTQSSRGRLSFETIDIRNTLEVPVKQSCPNREQARKHVKGENKYDIRVYSYPKGTCSFSNAGRGNVNMNKGNVGNKMTLSHELGHLFRLGHSRDYHKNKCRRRDKDGLCPDSTTYLGYVTPQNYNYNIVDLHWMGWLKKHEVERILPNKIHYSLRAVNREIQDGEAPLALVFDHPISGNRIFIAMPVSAETLESGKKRLESHELVLYIASKGVQLGEKGKVQISTLVHRFRGGYTDETGLSIRVTEATSLSEAKLEVSYDPAIARCTAEPEFIVDKKLIKPVDKNSKGKIALNITMKNPNEETCRPFFLFGGRHIKVFDPSGTKELNKKHDGIRINTINEGFNYIWPQDKIKGRSKHKNRRKDNQVKYEVVSTDGLENARARVWIGDFAPIDIDLDFNESN